MSDPRHRGVTVELAGVRKAYGSQVVLAGIDLRVEAGEVLAIVGQSGTGKSVLLRLICGLEPPDAGSIRVGGVDIVDYGRRRPADKPFRIAMVFQNAALLASLTIEENVALRLLEVGGSPAAQAGAVARRALGLVDLAGAEAKLPGELSGGMRKRASIARAIAVEPELILYDEPTADLDPLLTEQIAEVIARIRDAHGSTQILVTHNLPLARLLAHRVAILVDGRIAQCLPAADLAHGGHPVLRELLRASTLGT